MPRFSSLWSLLSIASLALSVSAAQAGAPQPLSAAQTAGVNKLIHDYIIAHPDVVMEALQAAQDKADAAQHANAESALSQHQHELLDDPDSPVLGNPKGDVTLVEFFDYRCPYCKSIAPDINTVIHGDPHLRVVMKEFPVLGPESVYASRIALVAADHGKYAAFHDAVLAYKGTLDNDETLAIAKSIGLNPKIAAKEAEDPAIDTILQANLDLARTLSIDGTPCFVIGDTIIPGVVSIDDLKQAIAAARSKS